MPTDTAREKIYQPDYARKASLRARCPCFRYLDLYRRRTPVRSRARRADAGCERGAPETAPVGAAGAIGHKRYVVLQTFMGYIYAVREIVRILENA